MPDLPEIDPARRVAIEAAVYRKMIEHLRRHPQVQNIELMNLAYFCRNCFAKWYRAAAGERGVDLSSAEARERVYGMPYVDYQAQHGEAASAEQLRRFESTRHKATE